VLTNPLGTTLAAGSFTASAVKMLAPQGEPLSPVMTQRSLSVKFSTVEVALDRLKAASAAADA